MLVGLPNGVLLEDQSLKHRLTTILLALLFGTAACGGSDSAASGSDITGLTSTTRPTATQPPASQPP